MKSRQVFTYIWRINAVIILLMGILASASFAATVWGLFRQATRTQEVSNVVNLSTNDEVKVKTTIGTFGQISGTDIIKAPLYLIQEYDYRAGSKESSSVQNYIFYDPTKKVSYWLRPKSEGLLLSTIALPDLTESTGKEHQLPTVGYVYLVADKDTNNDKRINDEDQKSIAISDPSGLRFKVLINQVDRFNGTSTIKNNRVSILYQSENKLKVAEVDLRSQEIVSNSEFSSQP
jgi:hypothetical protein